MSPETRRRRARHRRAAPTFSRDVAPIFYDKCVSCHRPGEVAPMSLITYRDVRPWASAIREKVTTRVMPPWHADRQYGSFRNDLSLTQREIDTIAAWVEAGASEGNPSELPALPKFPEGWQIGHARSGVPDAGRLSDAQHRARSTISTSRSRPISPKTGGCRPAKCVPAIARTSITSSSTCASRSRATGRTSSR